MITDTAQDLGTLEAGIMIGKPLLILCFLCLLNADETVYLNSLPSAETHSIHYVVMTMNIYKCRETE